MEPKYQIINVESKRKEHCFCLPSARVWAETLFKEAVGLSKEAFIDIAIKTGDFTKEEAEEDFKHVLEDAGIYIAELNPKDKKYYINKNLY